MPETIVKNKNLISEENENKYNKNLLKFLAYALIGFSLSQLDALGNISPFSVSFVSGLPFDYCFCAFLGSSMGYFISRQWKEALRYVFALLICTLFRLIVHRKFEDENNEFVCSVVAFCAIICSGAAYLAFTSLTFETALPVVFESALSLLGTILFMKARDIPVFSIGFKKLSAKDLFYLIVNACIFLMCLSGFSVGTLAPARIIASFIVIFSAHYKGISASSIVSICAGLSLSIAQSMHFMFPLFIISGLAAGIFSSFGQYVTALSFAVCGCIITVVSSLDNFNLYPLVEVVIAAVVFAAIPSKWISFIQDKIEQNGLIEDEQVERQVCANLERAAQKISDVSMIVTKVSEKLDKVINPEINRIFAKMQQNVCYGCNKKNECWNKMFNETATDIMTIAGINTSYSSKTGLENRCIRPNALLKEIDKYYDDFVNNMASKIKITEMRNIVSDQFSGISQFLSEIAEQMRTSKVINKQKSRTVKSALEDNGIFSDELYYYINNKSGIMIEASFSEDILNIDRKKMKKTIETVTGRKFEREEIAIMDDCTMIIFEEKPKFKVQIGQSQIPFAKNNICGDCIGRAYDLCGNEIALISDGMGTGSRAAIDATMTAALFEKLLSCGFSFESTIKMVNSALMVKSSDESLSTVDAVSVNIYTGQAVFFKAGASVSFIRHKKAITEVEEDSMPIGILRDVRFAQCSVNLEKGDIVLLVSDGVTSGETDWINEELLAWTTNSMSDLAAHIASLAKLRSEKNSGDDISVVAVKLY